MVHPDDKTPKSSPFDLRGKQSVRATFKLSQKAIDSIGLLAVHMGIKQKSLFDHLIEDTVELEKLAARIRIGHFKKIPRVQKTYVLSRKTVDALEYTSQIHDTPRDALVEYSIQKLESIIQSEKIKHEHRKSLQKEVNSHFENGLELLTKALDTLGEDDPFCSKLRMALGAYQKSKHDIDQFIEKSKILEDF